MAPTLSGTWRSFWHTMTSNDRHASPNSPYRTGAHAPLSQSRHTTLTSVATDASESRTDLSTSYTARNGDDINGSSSAANEAISSASPYSPGMRSAMQRRLSSDAAAKSLSTVQAGEIQMQNFSDGLPPPPPVSHSWKRIDRWVEDNYEELYDNLSEGCTQNDVNELEHELDCTLPMEVRESLQIHDGQERGGLPTGIIFGCMLLDCEEIVHEWQNWRRVNEDFLSDRPYQPPQPPTRAFAGASSSSSLPLPQQPAGNPLWQQDLLARQDSQPPNAVQRVYAHPAWIPLARDWGGNNLAVDLAPGPAGKWGQVIIFGRDYDCKYVVARSWSAFLATLADDLGSSKVFVNEESGELKLREFKEQNVEPAYLDILRWRLDQKYGRKGLRRRPNGSTSINTNVANGISPYASPVEQDRGRSPQRFANRIAASSPRPHLSSPLARVAEEGPRPIRVHMDTASRRDSTTPSESLMSMNTPRQSVEKTPGARMSGMRQVTSLDGSLSSLDGSDKENDRNSPPNGSIAKSMAKYGSSIDAEDMKTVEI